MERAERSPDETCVEALASGFVLLVSIVPAIGYSLVAYLSAAAFVHDVFNELGRLVRLPNFTPHAILTILLKPMVLLMGVGLEEAHYGARVLATGFLSNELGAFQELTTYAASGLLSVRTRRVLSFAVCGFHNLGSLGIVFGMLSLVAPGRSTDIASIGFSALVSACVANYLTACTVGKYNHENKILPRNFPPSTSPIHELGKISNAAAKASSFKQLANAASN
ncbi:hypothetical protein HPB48_020728 [Haemaphysalis longicornis]|uniref:Concentrative nucleoside transporter C-terminal domain-containing protein n=1 Tax=Haemaphysalis longicornis TaxID=44386 RepID=A0A9J6G845_HAELO|nr:hypothetical protein HPB48_020728 [Haemaphysalis longicornis]